MLLFVIEPTAVTNKFSPSTLLALFVGALWGLFLGSFNESAGPWLVALLGPPVALLLSPKSPILSWQTPVIAATISTTILNRDRGDTGSGGPADTFGSLLLIGCLNWVMFTAFSCPWGFIFQRRAKKGQEPAQPTPEATPARVGTVFLVFLACSVVVIGAIATVWPVGSASQTGMAEHFYSLLVATAGVALSIGTYWLAHRVGIADSVKQVLELALVLAVVSCGLFFIGDFLPGSSNASGSGPAQSPLGDGIWCLLTALEAGAGLVFLARMKKRFLQAATEMS